MNVISDNRLKGEIDEIINLYKHKNFDEALILSNKLIEKEKNIPFLLNLNGLINLSLEKWLNAISVFKLAIDCDENFVEAYNNIGVAYNHLGDNNKAIENYNRAIKLKKDYSNGYNNLASLYDDLGNYSEAAKNYISALKFNPEHPNAQNNLIHLMNYFNIEKVKGNPIIKANNELKKINSGISIDKKIENTDLSDYFFKCNNIVKKNLSNLSFFDSQIHRRNGYDLNCDRHYKVFNKFSIIPKYCFSCFKVQIEFKNVTQLFGLFFIFDQLKLPNDNIRKCFIELRSKIPGSYKGLIYCSSMNEAQDVYKIINPLILNIIKDEFNIAIKIGCSEFDLVFPGYKDINNLDKVSYDNDWKKSENIIDQEISNGSKKRKKIFSRTLPGVCLGDVLIMNNWLNYAKLIGDESYNDISNEIFFSEYILHAVNKRNIKNNKL